VINRIGKLEPQLAPTSLGAHSASPIRTSTTASPVLSFGGVAGAAEHIATTATSPSIGAVAFATPWPRVFTELR
jgi:hypothetical protein